MPKVKTKRAKDRPPKLSRQYLRDQQWVFDHSLELMEKYPDEWIIVHKGEVLASGDKAFDIWRRAKELDLEQPFLFLVEKGIHVY
jgi:ABC-type Na+ transport system ATPase subunit NatA